MAKWNKKIGSALFSLGLLAMTPNVTEAADCYSCDPCDPCGDQCCNESCFGGVDFGVDFLLWKPAVNDLDWSATLVEETVPGTGFEPSGIDVFVKYHDVCPGWEPGFRLRLSKDACWCDWRLGLSYTRVKSSAHDHVDSCLDCTASCTNSSETVVAPPVFGSSSFSPSSQINFAQGKWESTYQAWDILFAYDIDCCRCHVFSPFFGVAGLNLDMKLEADYQHCPGTLQNSIEYKWTDSFFGAGLKVGSGYSYNICDCLKLFATASGSLIVGDDDARNTQTFWDGLTTPNFVTVRWKDDDCARILPGYHFQLGVLYESCYCGTEWGFRLGWEFVEWLNVANHRTFVSDATVSSVSPPTSANVASSTSPNTRAYGFHGLLAGLEVHF